MTPLKPSELSIGNLLNYDTGEGIELTVIDWQDLKWLQERPESFNNSHTPVPLTPEILEGFGFEIERPRVYKKDNLTIFDHCDGEYYQLTLEEDEDGNMWHFHSPIHAHTLQNFVQAISGVELVYKEKPNNTKQNEPTNEL